MKAQCAALSLYHILPGHHREATMWHDADHKAEVVGTMPHVFISQRWVTPPDWLPLAPPSSLPEGGGEYVNLYWSSGTAEQMGEDFRRLGQGLAEVGRMEMADKYMQKVWPLASPGRLLPSLFRTRPGLALSGEAVVASTAMTALLTRVETVSNDQQRESFRRWHEDEYIPMVLETGLFAGVAKLAMATPGADGQFVTFYYLDSSSPAEAYVQFRETTAEWEAKQLLGPAQDAAHRTMHESLACPSIGHYDYYD